MSDRTHTGPWFPERLAHGHRPGAVDLVSLVLGIGFTLALFFGIAHVQNLGTPPTPLPPEDIRVEDYQPPAPSADTVYRAEPDEAPMSGFELAPSSSDTSIAVGPLNPDSLVQGDLEKAPVVSVSAGSLSGPAGRIDYLANPRHVFDKSGVDQVPVVLARTDPDVPRYVSAGANVLACTIMSIINADGSIGLARILKPSGNPGFDALIISNFREWTFSPALKRGKKVRCLIEQYIRVKCSTKSPLEG
jgi:hypothetical protein